MSSSTPPAYQQPNQPEPFKAGGEPPIWAPWYGIGFVDAVKRPFKKYADFSGRASRGEYWWFYLAYVGGIAVLYTIFGIIATIMNVSALSDPNTGAVTGTTAAPAGFIAVTIIFQILIGLIVLGLLVPYLALTWRRLHDAGYPGPYFFLGIIPLVGPILLIVYLATGSRPEGQRFDQPR